VVLQAGKTGVGPRVGVYYETSLELMDFYRRIVQVYDGIVRIGLALVAVVATIAVLTNCRPVIIHMLQAEPPVLVPPLCRITFHHPKCQDQEQLSVIHNTPTIGHISHWLYMVSNIGTT